MTWRARATQWEGPQHTEVGNSKMRQAADEKRDDDIGN